MSWFETSSGNNKNNDKELETLGKLTMAIGTPIAALMGLKWLGEQVGLGSGSNTNVGTSFNAWADTILQTAAYTAGGGAVAATAAVGGYAYAQHYHRQYAQRHFRYIRILPHADTRNEEEEIFKMIDGFYHARRPKKEQWKRGRVWYQLLIVCNQEDEIHFYLGFPEDREEYIPGLIRGAYSDCETLEVPMNEVPLPFLNKGMGGTLVPSKPEYAGYPFQSFDGKEKITSLLSVLVPGTYVAINFSPIPFKTLDKTVGKTRDHLLGVKRNLWGQEVKAKQKGELDDKRQEKLDNLKNRLRGNALPFDVQIHIWQEDNRNDVIHSLVNQLNVVVGKQDQLLRLKEKGESPIERSPYPYPWGKGEVMTWTAVEVANLIHLPSGRTKEQKKRKQPHIMDRIPHLIAGQVRVTDDEFTEGIPIGYLLHPVNEKRLIRLLEKKLQKMGLVVGQIGSGKTALILKMIRAYLVRRLGFTFVDPKAEAVWTILTYLRERQIAGDELEEDRLHYFDLASEEFSVGMNLLQPLPGQSERDVVNNTIEILKNAYPNDSGWLKKFARPSIKALMRDKTEIHSVLALPEFLKEESPLRDRIKQQLEQGATSDRELKRELDELEDKFGGTQVEPILNRLKELIDNPITKRMFGQKQTSLNVLEWVENGHMVLFNTQGLTREETRLVMGYIAVLYHQAAQNRKNTSSNHYLFIDEAHEVGSIPIFHEQIIPKDRSKGLSLFMLTQFPEQFPEKLKTTIEELAGTIISFTSGEATAREIERLTNGSFAASDIHGLKELRGAVYTQNSKGEKVNFFIEADPPYVIDRDGELTYYGDDEERINRERNNAWREAQEELGNVWMTRDCMTAAEVDAEMNAYLEKLWAIEMPRGTGDDQKSKGGKGKEKGKKGKERKSSQPQGTGLKPVQDIPAFRSNDKEEERE
ncbi:type IV secretory system conjugative DNA transfer family protein [Desmospora activa]|uniref:DNA helicase HerA-like ATPase n=1 Tax=Desmospora activa DSM 45169 TaxID=1121389 RepID=A0A2T4YYZ1_9BACL|nr:ATP-binding protein [Desmospora activa]PTM52174.1 DNA helicase HerA-like ATPase [Desmospora activa DSM 45169]